MPESINPILLDIPEELLGERILLRPHKAGDGHHFWEAINESREHLSKWTPLGESHRLPGRF